MSGLNSILNTAGSALNTYQSALNVTGQNIANADNPDYSIQNAEYSATTPVTTGGQTYGTGVTVAAVSQEVNQTLENQLTTELSIKAALEEEEIYTSIIEDLFVEGTDDSLNNLLDNYWSSWESLSNNPSGATEQMLVYETGLSLTQRINAIDGELDGLIDDLDRNIVSGVDQINLLTGQIAALNQTILSAESNGSNANDLMDQRNALVDELGELIDIDVTVKEDGSYLITTSGGLPLVSDSLSYSLDTVDDRIYWNGSSGNVYDITDDISGGALGGWLNIRDEVIPETRAELDELASQLIWTMNYQHSQGAGQSYFEGPVEGTYAAGDSGVLDSLAYGDRIDYSEDFSMVIQDASSADTQYETVEVDMGISQALITDLEGTGEAGCTYEFTVVDTGLLGEQNVAQTGGEGLGAITTSASGDVADALDLALAEQTLTITGGAGTEEILISDSGTDAGRSAGEIAEELDGIDGITAYASSTEAEFSLNGITGAQDGDIVRFTLYVDGVEQLAEFTVDSSAGSIEEQFVTALEAAVQEINEISQSTDLMVDGTAISSQSGATIGVQDFEVIDNAGVALDGFQNFDTGDIVTLTVATDDTSPVEVEVMVDLADVDTTDSAQVAQAFYDALEDQLADASFTVEIDETTGQVILRTTDGTGLSLSAASGDTGNDARMAVTALGGSTAVGDSQLDFDGVDQAGAAAGNTQDDYLVFSLPGCGLSSIDSSAAVVGEVDGIYDTCAVVVGSVTILMDPGMEITSDETSSAGLFGASGSAGDGNSLITLGGTEGYENFNDGENIVFQVDGIDVAYTVTSVGGQLTDAEQAQQLYDALVSALPEDGYEVTLNGTAVSIVRTAEADAPLSITGFSDTTGQDAALAVSTGTGTYAEAPENRMLVSDDPLSDSASAVPWGDPATIYWESFDSSGQSTGESGFVEIDEPGLVEITGDGQSTLTFEVSEGSLVAGNTMRVNTNADGENVDTLSDWHWTLDSFADEFNRSAGGVTASVTDDNTLVFDSDSDYCAIESFTCSGAYGIDEENVEIVVLNYTALDTPAQDLQFVRTDGTWEVANDPTGETMQIIPEGGDDDGFMVDLDGDGLGDIEIRFDRAVTGDGAIQTDLVSREPEDLSFAFAGDEEGDSGLLAALGINTFFTGTDAGTMDVNEILADGDYIAAGMVDPVSCELSPGDNTNALAMADTRYETLDMKQWTYSRGESPVATLSETTLDEYEHTMIAAIGFASQSVQSSLDYAENMVYQLTAQRDSVSAVSLDEEMIRLTAQQQAYEAAAQLLNAVDEMFAALLNIR